MWKKCQACGKDLEFPRRYDSKYCNATCRKQAERKRKNASSQALYNLALPVISKFSKVSEGDRPKAIESLKILEQAIKEQLRLLGDADEIARREMFENMRRKRS